MSEPLIHSMSELAPVMGPLIDAWARGGRIVEVGVEHGGTTGWLLERCAQLQAEYVGIDPAPSAEARAQIEDAGARLDARTSEAALAEHLPAACVLIDGDHNFHTVRAELEAVMTASPGALVLLHDTAWPCARRDFYYDPACIPDPTDHEWRAGPVPGRTELSPDGFRGAGSFAVARTETGGVLTAVEDAVAAHAGWRTRTLDAVFGLCVLIYEPSLRPEQAEALARFDTACAQLGSVVEKLEANRVKLYADLLAARAEAERLRARPPGPAHRIAELATRAPPPAPLVMPTVPAHTGHTVRTLTEAVEHLDGVEVLSLDVWDTLVVRTTEPPARVRDASADRASLRLCELGIPCPSDLFRAVRDAAEDRLRAQSSAGETRLSAVIERTLADLGVEIDGLAEELCAWEVENECEHARAAPGAADLIAAARRRRIRVVAVSDMYLEADRLDRILRSCGLEVDQVFASGEIGVHKAGGELYDFVAGELGVEPGEILHVGDHGQSDGASAMGRGVRAVVIDDGRADERRRVARGLSTGDPETVLGELPTTGEALHDAGVGAIGPAVFLYLHELLRRSVELRAQRVLFLAREGVELLRLARIVAERADLFRGIELPEMDVLRVSRRSATIAACDGLDETFRRAMLFRRETVSIGEALKAVGLDLPDDARLDPSTPLGDLGAAPALDQYIKIHAGVARAGLCAHLDSLGALGGGSVVLADVGWNATIQALLARAVSLGPVDDWRVPEWVGVYLGRERWFGLDWRVRDRSRVEPGVVYDSARPDAMESAVGECKELFEVALASGEGTTLGYERDGTPILGEPAPRLVEQANPLQAGIEVSVIACCEAVNRTLPDRGALRRASLTGLDDLLRRPTRAQAEAVGSLRHELGWGFDETIELAPRPTLGDLLLRRSETVHGTAWPTGALARAPVPGLLKLRGWSKGLLRRG